MTRKEEVKLNRLLAKIDAMRDIVLCLLSEKGTWDDGTGKDRLVFQVDKTEISDVVVKRKETQYPTFAIVIGGDEKVRFDMSDKDLAEVLLAGMKKVIGEKEMAKKKADKERQKKSNVSHMDVFNRVAKFIKANGYSITTPQDENSEIAMKVGTVRLWWHNVKEFVSAGNGVHGNWDREGYVSIFNVISYWSCKYYKLVYPSLRKLVDKVGVLGNVNKKAVVPVAIMDELDRLKI